MKKIDFPSDAVLVAVARAKEKGPWIDIHVSEEWWAAASKDHRKALFMKLLQSIGEVGNRVIPEEFSEEAGRPIDPLPEI
jgi:hypothetical protein